MEKRQKTALESGVLILIVAAILVAVNALSALGLYKPQGHDQDREVHALEGQREPAPLDEAERSRSTPTSPRGCPSSTPSCAIFATCCRSTRTRAAGKFDYTLIEPRTTTEEEGQGRRPRRAAVRRGERHRRQGGRDPGLHGPRLQVRRAAGRHQVLPPTAPTASSSGSRTRFAKSATRATTSTTRSAS
jgi:hypothetical protein